MRAFPKCHPAVNYLYYISAVVFGVIFRHPVFLFIFFASSVAYYIKLYGRDGVKTLFSFYLILTVLVTVINGLTAHYGVTVLIERENGNNICLEPIVYGFVTALSACGVIMLLACYNKTVPNEKLMFVIGRRFPKIALILSMSLRFVPLYKEKLREISDAQKAFGLGVDSGGAVKRIRCGGKIIGALLSSSLEGAVETADSMRGRGYSLKGRTSYSNYRLTPFDVFLLALFTICDILVIVGASLGEAFVIYNPFFKINDVGGFSFVVYASYAVLLFTPFLTHEAEDLKWKKSERKI